MRITLYPLFLSGVCNISFISSATSTEKWITIYLQHNHQNQRLFNAYHVACLPWTTTRKARRKNCILPPSIITAILHSKLCWFALDIFGRYRLIILLTWLWNVVVGMITMLGLFPRRHRSLIYKLLVLVPVIWITVALFVYSDRGTNSGQAESLSGTVLTDFEIRGQVLTSRCLTTDVKV